MVALKTRIKKLLPEGWLYNIRRTVESKPVMTALHKVFGSERYCCHPFIRNVSLSDFIPWRCDDTWDTKYHIMNLPSLLEPARKTEDRATVLIHNKEGEQILNFKIDLEPFGNFNLIFSEHLDKENYGFGTFSIFHDTPNSLFKYGAYVFDRQYVSHKRHTDPLWSYVHGNLVSTAKKFNKEKATSLVLQYNRTFTYTPQVQFLDCQRAELFYANQTDKLLEVTIGALKKDGTINESLLSVMPRGLGCFSINYPTIKVSGTSKVKLLRPVIFKYYESHYDVFHS